MSSPLLPSRCRARRGTAPIVLAGAITAALFTAATRARADDPFITQPVARATRISDAPVLDGKLDDAVWSQVELAPQMPQIEPIPAGEPTFKTDVYIAHDGETLFFGIRCYDDDPEAIVEHGVE